MPKTLTEKFGLRELRAQNYKSIFLSIGTQRGRDLTLEGSEA